MPTSPASPRWHRPTRGPVIGAVALAIAAGLVAAAPLAADAATRTTSRGTASAGATPSPGSSGPSSIDSGAPSTGSKAPNVTFGIQPANPEGATPRAFFDLQVARGTVTRDNVRITNFSQAPLHLKVYPANAATALDGGYVVTGFQAKPSAFAGWTQIAGLGADRFLTLPARTRIDLPVFVTVPSTAQPGDYGGAIVVSYFSIRKDAKGNVVDVENRVASRVYTRVAGPVHAGVRISALTVHDHHTWLPWGKDRLTGSFVVRNTGTIRESVADLMTLAGVVHGRRTVALGGPGDILPGGAVQVTIPAQRTRPGLRMTVGISATATQVPVGPGGPALVMASDRATVSVWTLPWPTLVALVLLALVAAGVVLWLKRRAPKRPSAGRRRTNGKPVSLDTLIDLTDQQPSRQGVVRRLTAAAFLPVVLAVAGSCFGLAAAPAQAAGHHLYFAPPTGLDVTPAFVVTDAPCPATSSNVVGRAFGHGFPAAGQPVISNSTAGVSHTAPFVLPLQDTMYDFAKLNRVTLSGAYRITLTCSDRLLQKPTTVFTGAMTFTGNKHYTAPAAPAAVVAAIQAEQSAAGAVDSSPAIGSQVSPSPGATAQPKPSASAGAGGPSPSAGNDLSAEPQAGGASGADLGAVRRTASHGPVSSTVAILAGAALVLAARLLIVDQRRRRLRSERLRRTPVVAPPAERKKVP